MIDFSQNHFALFGLSPRFRLDAAALDDAYRRLQTDVHPDRFAAADDAQRRLSLQASAQVNEAYRTLADPVLRAQYLLAQRGVQAVGDADTQLPFAFLERQLERREAASDAQAAGDEDALAALLAAVRADRRALEGTLARMLDDEHGYAAARVHVRELTFLAKLADDLDAMLATVE
jgi:molecular chaperone HscB